MSEKKITLRMGGGFLRLGFFPIGDPTTEMSDFRNVSSM
jgi:hypothetical protein